MNPPRIGIIFPPEFWRLPLEIGAAHCYFVEQQKRELPTPYVFIGSSAGGIAAACSVAWTESHFLYLRRVIRNLKPEQIYKSTLRDKIAGTFFIADSAFHFLTSGEKFPWWKKLIFAGGSLGTKIGVIYEILRAPSAFSNEPLLNLLKKNLDFDAVFNSPIKLEILTLDKETREKIIYTNYIASDKKPERLIDGLAGTSALPLIFPCRQNGEKLMVDGAVHPLNTMPFYRALENDCDVIIVLQFAPFNDKELSGCTAGLKIVSQCFNITTSEIGSEAKNKIESLVGELGALASKRTSWWNKLGLSKKDEFFTKIDEIRKTCSEFSFTEMKNVKILVTKIDPKLLLPLSIHKFKPEQMKLMLDLGYEAMGPVLDDLEKILKEKPSCA